MYLVSLGRPTDIGLQLGKACYHSTGVGRGGCFYFFCFFTFINFPLLCPSLSSPLLSLLSLFFLSLETTQNDPKGLTCR